VSRKIRPISGGSERDGCEIVDVDDRGSLQF
jgi:hypothetical protein